jgi:hypothetical protein
MCLLLPSAWQTPVAEIAVNSRLWCRHITEGEHITLFQSECV